MTFQESQVHIELTCLMWATYVQTEVFKFVNGTSVNGLMNGSSFYEFPKFCAHIDYMRVIDRFIYEDRSFEKL